MIALIFGFAAIGIGFTGFTQKGISVTSSAQLNGTPGKIIGTLSILMGLAILSLPYLLT